MMALDPLTSITWRYLVSNATSFKPCDKSEIDTYHRQKIKWPEK